MENELFKIRSVSACLKDAYVLLNTNFKTIIGKLWLPLLCLSLSMGLYMLFGLVLQGVVSDESSGMSVMTVVGMSVSLLAAFVCSLWTLARLFPMLNGQSQHWNFVRALKLALFWLACLVVLSIVIIAVIGGVVSMNGPSPSGDAAGIGFVKMMGAISIVLLLFMVFCLPFVYTFMKYLMEPDMKLKQVVGQPYKTGFHRWGYLFGNMFLSYLIYYILYLVAFIPVIILAIVCYINGQGMIDGDPSGMPNGLSILSVVVTTLCFFVVTFISIWMLFVFYYVYGSIEARKRLTDGPQNPTEEPKAIEGETEKALEA